MKQIGWKQMKQLEPGLKQTEGGGKPSYSVSDICHENISSKEDWTR